MKILAFLLIVLGIFIALYPSINEHIQNKKQQVLVNEFVTAPPISPQQFEQLGSHVTSDVEPPRQLDEASKSMLNGAMALIKIDKIDLVLPILEGATDENMKMAATHISETTKFGEVGNVGIAAHRARTYGRLFNRLGEVKVGDQILIRETDKDYTYIVFKTFVVKPDDITVLNYNNKDFILTLVTCTYVGEETDRLIVQARRI